MHLKRFSAERIKCFEHLTVEFPAARQRGRAGWYVFLGANATGKTTLLQAMAAALVGPQPAMRLFNPANWVRRGADHGRFVAEFVSGADDVAEGAPRKSPYKASFVVTGERPVTVDKKEFDAPGVVLLESESKEPKGLLKGPYSASKRGWLVCGYGSFRRFTGGAEDDLSHERGKVGRIASLYRESVALKRGLDWLPRAYARSLEPHAAEAAEARREYEAARGLIDRLLPDPVRIAGVDVQRVMFSAPGATQVELSELSDGYRCFLALAIDLISQIADVFGSLSPHIDSGPDAPPRVLCDGVVFIDEIDLHLHPSWQRHIGRLLTETFPNMQFIVSSHSPFVAQTAVPEGLFVLKGGGANAPVEVVKPARDVAGWTADQILLSPLFDLEETRDPVTQDLLAQHAKLRGKSKFGTLTAQDQRRLMELESRLAARLTGPGELPNDVVERAIRAAAKAIRGAGDAEA